MSSKQLYKQLIFNNKLFTVDTNNNNNTSQVQSETCGQELEHRLQAVESKLSEVVDSLHSKLTEHHQAITSALAEQLTSNNMESESEATINGKGTQITAHPVTSDPAEAINEYMDRQRRRCNLIIRNVPESSKQEKSKQSNEDTAKISELFQKEFGIERTQIKKITRLGRRVQDQARLILVTVNEEEAERQILCI